MPLNLKNKFMNVSFSLPILCIAAPPQRILSNFLHAFVDSSRGEIPFRPTTLPLLGLSSGDKQCIRDRSSIMARHFFADKSEDFINAQVCFVSIQRELHIIVVIL